MSYELKIIDGNRITNLHNDITDMDIAIRKYFVTKRDALLKDGVIDAGIQVMDSDVIYKDRCKKIENFKSILEHLKENYNEKYISKV